MGGTSKLRVVLDARLSDGDPGGVQQTILGLAHGLSSLDGDGEEYLFLGDPARMGWLAPHLRGRCKALPLPAANPGLLRTTARKLGLLDPIARLVYEGPLGALAPVELPASDGTIERAGADVMHFTTQAGFRTRVPSVYVPHDLLHLHHPRYFPPFALRWRAAHYGPLSEQARFVVALTQFGKRDLVERLRIPPAKVPVIPWAPVLQAYADPTAAMLDEARTRLALPERFLLYPAQTHPHKNHLALLDALARLRDELGVTVVAVFTGKPTSFRAVLDARIRTLRLSGQARFLGFVSPSDIRCLYRLATLLVYPSRFEGFGMPIWEAFEAGLPVVSSNAAALREVTAGAALLFDPDDPPGFARALAEALADPGLRESLISRGREVVRGKDWREVALRYRALYRAAAGQTLGEEDRALLASMTR
ncbi:MAG TPA: glycosyltransferase family 1 protein [Myxococcales bacterium]|jgi:glycosyltransferase involved in cell wall biosynthesis